VKNAYFSPSFYSDSTNTTQIAHRRPGGERAPNTAYFAWRAHCNIMVIWCKQFIILFTKDYISIYI
jgi:hypothetical protein